MCTYLRGKIEYFLLANTFCCFFLTRDSIICLFTETVEIRLIYVAIESAHFEIYVKNARTVDDYIAHVLMVVYQFRLCVSRSC